MPAVGMTDVRTHPFHPQSNGQNERVRRTLRAEVPLEEHANLYEARSMIEMYRQYYHERRPHSALDYLGPRDYYRGAPTECLAQRQAKLRQAAAARRTYWEAQRPAANSLC